MPFAHIHSCSEIKQMNFLPNHAVAMTKVKQKKDSSLLHSSVQPLAPCSRQNITLRLLIQFVTVPFVLLISSCELQKSFQTHGTKRGRLLCSSVVLPRRRTCTNDFFVLHIFFIMLLEVVSRL